LQISCTGHKRHIKQNQRREDAGRQFEVQNHPSFSRSKGLAAVQDVPMEFGHVRERRNETVEPLRKPVSSRIAVNQFSIQPLLILDSLLRQIQHQIGRIDSYTLPSRPHRLLQKREVQTRPAAYFYNRIAGK
jgi:hypothetical protein